MKVNLYKVGAVSSRLSLAAILLLTSPCDSLAQAQTGVISFNNDGVRALSASNFPLAIEKFEAALRLDPTYKLARENLAIAYNNYGLTLRQDPPAALKQFHKSFLLNPSNPITQQNLDGIIRYMNLDPKKFEDRRKLAEDARKAGDFTSAIVEYLEALKLREDANSRMVLGDVYRVVGREARAVEQYRIASGSMNSAEILVKLAQAEQAVKNMQGAWSAVSKAMAIAPADRDVLEAAQGVAEKMVQLEPQSANNHIYLGIVLQQRGDFGKANSEYDQALKFDPNSSEAQKRKSGLNAAQALFEVERHFAKGNELLEKKQYSAAKSEFSAVLVARPNETRALTALGTIALSAGAPDEAQEHFRKALSFDEQNTVATRGMAQAAKLSEDQKISGLERQASEQKASGQLAEAQQTLTQLVAINPSSAKYHFLMGQLLEAKQNYETAIAEYKIAKSSEPANQEYASAVKRLAGILTPTTVGATQESTSADSSKTASSTSVAPNRPVADKWALVVGISKFANPAYDLKYAAKDAQDFYNYLINEGNFRKDHVLLLLNEHATRANVMEAFGNHFLPSVTKDGDLIVVFLSTHGTPSKKDKGGRNYIVAYDTEASKLYSTGVDMDDLYRRIKEGVKTDRALIVMDTCYSGAGVPGAKAAPGSYANFDATEIAQGCGHLVISSSSPNERSWESLKTPNGIFTKYLLQALRADKKTDIKAVFSKVQDQVGWEVQSAFNEKQTPQLGGDWEGRELILSVPATQPRENFNPDLLKLMAVADAKPSPPPAGAKTSAKPALPVKKQNAIDTPKKR